jgi:hypothetical protein
MESVFWLVREPDVERVKTGLVVTALPHCEEDKQVTTQHAPPKGDGILFAYSSSKGRNWLS